MQERPGVSLTPAHAGGEYTELVVDVSVSLPRLRGAILGAPGGAGWQRGRIDSRPELRHRRMHRWMREVLIGGILVALFLAFLYYLMQPHNYSGEGQ